MDSKLNFVRQQGIKGASRESCGHQYPGLMFQPRLIGGLVLVGLVVQAWPYFAALAVLLFWNAAVPRLNPFDALYNALVASPKGLPSVGPAPAPRRFAQGMAGSFMAGIAASLYAGWHPLAWILEGFLLVALGALIFGRFCMGSYVFLIVTGQSGFANRTVPWARAE